MCPRPPTQEVVTLGFPSRVWAWISSSALPSPPQGFPSCQEGRWWSLTNTWRVGWFGLRRSTSSAIRSPTCPSTSHTHTHTHTPWAYSGHKTLSYLELELWSPSIWVWLANFLEVALHNSRFVWWRPSMSDGAQSYSHILLLHEPIYRSSAFIQTGPAAWGLFRWLHKYSFFKVISWWSLRPRMMASERVAFLRHLKGVPLSPAKTREKVTWKETAQIPWLGLCSGCHSTCKCVLGRIVKEDVDGCLASLLIPIWQVRWRLSGSHASVFGELGLDTRDHGLFLVRIAYFSYFKSSCCVKAGKHSPWEQHFPRASPAVFADPLPRQERRVSSHLWQEGSRLSSFGGPGRWGARRVKTERLLGRSYPFKGQD